MLGLYYGELECAPAGTTTARETSEDSHDRANATGVSMGAHALILAHFDMIKAQGVAHFSCRSPAGSARGVCGALRRSHMQRHAPRVSVWRDLRVGGQGMSRAAPPYAYGRAWGVCVWGGALCAAYTDETERGQGGALCGARVRARLRASWD